MPKMTRSTKAAAKSPNTLRMMCSHPTMFVWVSASSLLTLPTFRFYSEMQQLGERLAHAMRGFHEVLQFGDGSVVWNNLQPAIRIDPELLRREVL